MNFTPIESIINLTIPNEVEMRKKTTPKKKIRKSKNGVVRMKVTPSTTDKKNHTPTLWRYQGNHPLFFGAKWDDFWFIERLWAIYSQRVYRNPRPTHIDGVMRRLREEVRQTDPKTLVKLCHDLPAKMNEIYRLKGKKIPSNFDPKKSPFACKCKICLS